MSKRGKVRGPGAGDGGGQGFRGGGPASGGNVSGVNGAGGILSDEAVGGGRKRTKLRPSETKAKLNERPKTVVIDGYEFAVLPSPSELAQFMFDCVLLTEIDKELLTKIQGVYSDENKRQFLVQMETEESMTALADLLLTGVTWPGYKNERAGRDVIVRGYSMENPIVNITINGVGLWTPEETLRKAVSTWGEVKEIK